MTVRSAGGLYVVSVLLVSMGTGKLTLAQEPVDPRPIPEPTDEERAINESVRAMNHCAPIYPDSAAAIQQEGWVIVEFTVSAEGVPTGSHVVDASPPDIFDASALEFLSKCRLQRVDGEAVETHGVRWRVLFEL